MWWSSTWEPTTSSSIIQPRRRFNLHLGLPQLWTMEHWCNSCIGMNNEGRWDLEQILINYYNYNKLVVSNFCRAAVLKCPQMSSCFDTYMQQKIIQWAAWISVLPLTRTKLVMTRTQFCRSMAGCLCQSGKVLISEGWFQGACDQYMHAQAWPVVRRFSADATVLLSSSGTAVTWRHLSIQKVPKDWNSHNEKPLVIKST